jgi:PAS domain S-box-containing protein
VPLVLPSALRPAGSAPAAAARPLAVAGAAVAVLATVVLAGWVLGIDSLKSGVPGLVTMKVNTALCFAASAGALWSLGRVGGGRRRGGRLLALLAGGVGALTFAEYALGFDAGIDQLLFRDPAGAVATSYPGRMAPNSALAFVLLACALVQLDRRSRWMVWLAPALAVAVGVLALIAILGYLSGVTSLYAVSSLTQMSVPAAVGFLLLAFGVFCARPDRGPMRLLTSDTVGGKMLRILFPGALAIPLLLAVLRLAGDGAGLFGPQTGTWLFAVSIIGLLVPMTWAVASSLDRAELSSRRAAAADGEAQRARAAFDNAPIGTALVSIDGHFQRVNAALSQLTGYAPEDLLGMHFGDLTHPDDRAGDADCIARLRTGEAKTFQREKRYLHAGGHVVQAQTEVTAILDAGGELAQFFVQILDITERVRAERRLEEAHLETLSRLAAAAEYRDDDTGKHTRRVGELASQLAGKLGLPHEQVRLIRLAAPLHDVGKIAIPDAVLLKPGRLTRAEFGEIKTHTTLGAQMLAGGAFPLLAMAEAIALTHHERWDGGGYPAGLSGDDIPIAGRIVAVADVFDALTHARPYKFAWSRDDALAEIDRQRGLQFDPQVVEAFFSVMSDAALDHGMPLDALTPVAS